MLFSNPGCCSCSWLFLSFGEGHCCETDEALTTVNLPEADHQDHDAAALCTIARPGDYILDPVPSCDRFYRCCLTEKDSTPPVEELLHRLTNANVRNELAAHMVQSPSASSRYCRDSVKLRGWLRSAFSGRPITLLSPIPWPVDEPVETCVATPAWLYVDIGSGKLIIVPSTHPAITIQTTSIQMMGSVTAFLVLFDQIRADLRSSDMRERAVIIQYISEETSSLCSVCLLEQSSSMKQLLMDSLTALNFEEGIPIDAM